MRTVVLLCGPPGAGKTTAARASGLQVFDRDDAEWESDQHFASALDQVGRTPHARCVVIRSCATSSARAKVVDQIQATQVRMLMRSREELVSRVVRRGRDDWLRTIAGIDRWLGRYDREDGVRVFESWDEVFVPDLGVTGNDW